MSFQSDILCPEDQLYLLEGNEHLINEVLFSEEQTLMVGDLKPQIQQLDIRTSVLCNEEYVGPYDFEVDILPNNSKNAWMYSAMLNKVYMNMKSPFPLDFRVKSRPNFPLFIRVTPMYSAPQHAPECVYRCLNHEHSDSISGRDNPMRPHIIRCSNTQTKYVGVKENKERLSLIIPFSLPQPGTDTVREMFEFMCKNSCPAPGMNRRAIEVIFSLENEQGELFGRRTLNVRICSCPKRDKEKDEKDHAGKPPPEGKRRIEKPKKKVVNNDVKEVLLTIPMIGKHNIDQVLKYCQDLLSGEIVRNSGNGTDAPYRQVLSKINAMRERTD